MTTTYRSTSKLLLKRSAVAVGLAALCATASALPVFTLSPAGAGLTGANFTADNVLISDYATVRFGAGNTFTETGFLAITGAQLGPLTLVPGGLNSTYGMYIKFTGTGTTGAGDPGLVATSGTFTTLNYTLFGYNGPAASFGFDAFNVPTENASGEVTLATGSLISGTVSTAVAGGGDFTPSAAAKLTFATAAGASFFVAPVPFYNIALSSFTNTVSQVTRFDGGFKISQGGGSFNFVAAPIPEPETYALMLAGLCAVGFMARRRSI